MNNLGNILGLTEKTEIPKVPQKPQRDTFEKLSRIFNSDKRSKWYAFGIKQNRILVLGGYNSETEAWQAVARSSGVRWNVENLNTTDVSAATKMIKEKYFSRTGDFEPIINRSKHQIKNNDDWSLEEREFPCVTQKEENLNPGKNQYESNKTENGLSL